MNEKKMTVNPMWVLFLGACPALGATGTLWGAAAMGITVLAVMLLTALVMALLRRILPERAVIAATILTAALFTSAAQLVLHAVLPLPVPASVYGLVLLLAALTAGVVKLEQVKETGTYLTGIFPLLFVPAAAGIMELWAEMGQLLLPILIAILPVTVLVMAAAGRTTPALTARHKKEEADHD